MMIVMKFKRIVNEKNNYYLLLVYILLYYQYITINGFILTLFFKYSIILHKSLP